MSGNYDAGHDAAAHEIATRLHEQGYVIEHHDIVALLPWRLARLLRWTYVQLPLSPRS